MPAHCQHCGHRGHAVPDLDAAASGPVLRPVGTASSWLRLHGSLTAFGNRYSRAGSTRLRARLGSARMDSPRLGSSRTRWGRGERLRAAAQCGAPCCHPPGRRAAPRPDLPCDKIGGGPTCVSRQQILPRYTRLQRRSREGGGALCTQCTPATTRSSSARCARLAPRLAPRPATAHTVGGALGAARADSYALKKAAQLRYRSMPSCNKV